jgi:hypothetical protein
MKKKYKFNFFSNISLDFNCFGILKDLINRKNVLERELNEYEARYLKLDEKYRELENKNKELLHASYEAKERLAQGVAEYQIKATVLDEEARRLKRII